MGPKKKNNKNSVTSPDEILPNDTMEDEITIKDVYMKLIKIENKLKRIDIIEKQITDMQSSLDFIDKKYEEQKLEILELKNSNVTLKTENKKLASSINSLKVEIGDLSEETNNLEQYGRREMVDIVGFPQSDEENTDNIVSDICENLNIEINVNKDIEVSHRVSSKPNAAIIVKFNNRRKRDEFYNKGRKSHLKLNAFGYEDDSSIYINESLTFKNRTTFKRSKDALRNKYKYIWLKNGVTLIKKDDQGKIHKILSEKDIDRYIN